MRFNYKHLLCCLVLFQKNGNGCKGHRFGRAGMIGQGDIGEVSQRLQIKLLQVLQERTFTPVGSHQASRFSGRVIAATNRPMAELRQKQILRDDFYYRLCSDVIEIPSLAQRISQDPLELTDLLGHTVNRILGHPAPELVDMVQATIAIQPGIDYQWPGNVRELEQCVRRILLKQSYTPPPNAYESKSLENILTDGIAGGRMDAQSLLTGYCLSLYRGLGTYEAVAKQANLDRRTAKKYVLEGKKRFGPPKP